MLDLTMQTDLGKLDVTSKVYRGREAGFTMVHLVLKDSKVRLTFDCWSPDVLVRLASVALAAAADLAEATEDAAAPEIARRWQDVADSAAWIAGARTNDEAPF